MKKRNFSIVRDDIGIGVYEEFYYDEFHNSHILKMIFDIEFTNEISKKVEIRKVCVKFGKKDFFQWILKRLACKELKNGGWDFERATFRQSMEVINQIKKNINIKYIGKNMHLYSNTKNWQGHIYRVDVEYSIEAYEQVCVEEWRTYNIPQQLNKNTTVIFNEKQLFQKLLERLDYLSSKKNLHTLKRHVN